jgi:hypothetical protein
VNRAWDPPDKRELDEEAQEARQEELPGLW